MGAVSTQLSCMHRADGTLTSAGNPADSASSLHCRQTAACWGRLLIAAIATWLIDGLIFVRPASSGPIARLETASTSARRQTAVQRIRTIRPRTRLAVLLYVADDQAPQAPAKSTSKIARARVAGHRFVSILITFSYTTFVRVQLPSASKLCCSDIAHC